MKHLVKQHRAQCMLYAFAMAMNVHPTDLTRIIGHDGTEKLWPELPEPQCYRGFHPCEFMYCAFKMFPPFAIYEFPRKVLMGHSDSTIKEVKTGFSLPSDIILYSDTGVFLTENHAYAWDGRKLLDPDKLPKNIGEEFMSHSEIDWHTYFAVKKIYLKGFNYE